MAATRVAMGEDGEEEGAANGEEGGEEWGRGGEGIYRRAWSASKRRRLDECHLGLAQWGPLAMEELGWGRRSCPCRGTTSRLLTKFSAPSLSSSGSPTLSFHQLGFVRRRSLSLDVCSIFSPLPSPAMTYIFYGEEKIEIEMESRTEMDWRTEQREKGGKEKTRSGDERSRYIEN